MNEGSAKQQIVEAIKSNSNILVTVSDNPSVDELSAALGLTILLNKIDKRATSIFSGAIPPAITFLDPDKTLESTVDSLRDFIIALDKEKADHLRYKVDGDVVKIFITPYRTTLTEKDLQFSQGDYNVELVIAIGVKDQDHLDKALAAHGKILHDATVTTISVGADPSTLGSIDWRDAAASSLCEMLVSLSEALKGDQPILDEQIATAFLTGIVSATDRFSNDHTTSRVMTMAAQLMAAGANQQLIAAKLQEGHDISPNSAQKDTNADGTVTISEDEPAKLEKDHKKSDKKAKTDQDGLKIDRDSKKSDKKVIEPLTPPVVESAEAAAVDEALQAAEPAKDVEDELAKQLDEVMAEPAVPAIADMEKELEEATKQEESSEPALDVPVPQVPDMEMPGFESLDMPAPAPAPESESPQAPAQDVSGFIESHPGNSYLAKDTPSTFDAPVDGIISSTGSTTDDQPVDPFSVPLVPLPDLHESKEVTPFVPSDQVDPSVFNAPANVTADSGLPAFEELAVPEPTPAIVPDPAPLPDLPTPPTDMPPLPPLPDFSALPPLPTPPPPPAFDQPGQLPAMPTQSGAISADKLGDIFGDTPATPAPEQSPAPSTPGQFKIPGQ